MQIMPVDASGFRKNKVEEKTQESNKEYFGYLDGLRFLAFFAVFYAHTGSIFYGGTLANDFPINILKKFFIYGSFGVNFFFVLSGFLITYLLLREKASKGTISIKNFYLRRVLRIWPVYFIALFFAAFILPFLIPKETYEILGSTNPTMGTETFLYFFFFLGNFYQGLGLGLGPLSMGILWSVCVEEQFYLIWPWIVRFFTTRRLALITILLISLSLLYKFLWAENRVANYYLPWSVGMDLAFGALFGIAYFAKKQSLMLKGIIITLLGSIAIVAFTEFSLESLRLFKTPIMDCVFVLILIFFIRQIGNPKRKILNALAYLGKISYGLYAYHTMCLMITVHLFYSTGFMSLDISRTMYAIIVISALTLTIVVAHFSSIFIEKYFLSLKNKFN